MPRHQGGLGGAEERGGRVRGGDFVHTIAVVFQRAQLYNLVQCSSLWNMRDRVTTA